MKRQLPCLSVRLDLLWASLLRSSSFRRRCDTFVSSSFSTSLSRQVTKGAAVLTRTRRRRPSLAVGEERVVVSTAMETAGNWSPRRGDAMDVCLNRVLVAECREARTVTESARACSYFLN